MLARTFKKLAVATVFFAAGVSAALSAPALQCQSVIKESTSAIVGTHTLLASKTSSMGSAWSITGGGCEVFDVQDVTGTLGDRQTAAITISRPRSSLTEWECQAKSDPGRVEPYKLRAIGIFCRVKE